MALPNRIHRQCRERWINVLCPQTYLSSAGNQRRVWTEEEDWMILSLYRQHGSCWSYIAKQIPGRSDNQVKNRFYSNLSKRIKVSNKGNCGLNTAATTSTLKRSFQEFSDSQSCKTTYQSFLQPQNEQNMGEAIKSTSNMMSNIKHECDQQNSIDYQEVIDQQEGSYILMSRSENSLNHVSSEQK